MIGRLKFAGSLMAAAGALAAMAGTPGLPGWQNDLTPISPGDWNYEFAAHLLERAGFGGTPEEIQALAAMTPAQAVARLVRFQGTDASQLPPFEHSGIHDPGLEPFPPSRPAVTALAKEKGEALGIQVKASGNRRLQPIVNEFFYWLRASVLETNRVAYWWANRMLVTPRPLQEKMALFWHGHFASNEAKVRDYRKLLRQLELFEQHGTGNFRELTLAVAQDPAMLSFLDAGVNVKGASNENFAREIMELFTMGPGNYTEKDIREGARAFTGWNYVDLQFVVNKDQHDDGEKVFLGKTGRFDGADVIDIIMQQPVTAEFIAGKIYRFFVRQELSPELQRQLGLVLRQSKYEIAPLLERIFLSRDFYSTASVGTRIKSPVELAISTYRKLGLKSVPGVPDFNLATGALGQQLFSPPTVAGWPEVRVGSRRVSCWSARILPVMFCFPTSAFYRRTGTRGAGKCAGWRNESGKEWTLVRQPWMTPRRVSGRSRMPAPTATRISIHGMAAFAVRRWLSNESRRFPAIRLRSGWPRWSLAPT